MLAVNFLHRKLTSVKKKERKKNVGRIEGSMCMEEMRKIGVEPEDEGEEIAIEIHFPALLILKLLNS